MDRSEHLDSVVLVCMRKQWAKEFHRRGVKAVAVYSDATGEFAMDRSEAIQKLKSGEINIIFSVDMFNEGVDVPSVDMVLFLRPTESPTVFLQQLGRGLRRSKGKEYLKVLDFIGNYKKAGNIRFFLTGKATGNDPTCNKITEYDLPDDCMIDFDLELIDLFEKMDAQQRKLSDCVYDEYQRIKQMIQRVPTRVDLYTYLDDEIYELCLKSGSKCKPFHNYVKWLEEIGELTAEQQNFIMVLRENS